MGRFRLNTAGRHPHRVAELVRGHGIRSAAAPLSHQKLRRGTTLDGPAWQPGIVPPMSRSRSPAGATPHPPYKSLYLVNIAGVKPGRRPRQSTGNPISISGGLPRSEAGHPGLDPGTASMLYQSNVVDDTRRLNDFVWTALSISTGRTAGVWFQWHDGVAVNSPAGRTRELFHEKPWSAGCAPPRRILSALTGVSRCGAAARFN